MNAPVVLFVYNRVDHVQKTLSALAGNSLAPTSELFIFSDGPKNESDIISVNEIRQCISDPKWKNHFKSITIIESANNKGLANSIINGVDTVIRKFGKVIVIEDDCITSNDFLTYMNEALEFYKNNDDVWSIGGYTFDMAFPDDYSQDIYLMGRTCSYAWATWLENWQKVDWEVKSYSKFKYNFIERYRFNRYGNDRAKMLDCQQIGKKNSWAIRFCYAMFENNMKTIYPRYTKVKNIGYDIGTHVNGNSKSFEVILSNKKIKLKNVKEDRRIVKQFRKKFKRPCYVLLISYFLNVIIPRKGV